MLTFHESLVLNAELIEQVCQCVSDLYHALCWDCYLRPLTRQRRRHRHLVDESQMYSIITITCPIAIAQHGTDYYEITCVCLSVLSVVAPTVAILNEILHSGSGPEK